MQGINSLLNSPPRSQISLQDLHNQIHPQPPLHFESTIAGGSGDDFLQQILSGAPSWPHGGNDDHGNNSPFHFDESAALASKLRHHQISSPSAAKLLLHHQFLNSDFKSPNNQGGVGVGDGSVQALFNGFAGAPNHQQQHFHGGSVQTYAPPGSAATVQNPQPAGSTGGGAPAQPRQRVRARRGQATDPHSIAERLRRERIAERMKALQELVPNANKTDKASMLDEIIDYVKFLQLQVKVLSMSRLGGAGAVAPLVADISSEARGGGGDSSAATGGGDDVEGLTVTESQVAKLMEEDMGSAMQYLQGKGLCLMPISLATAISTRNNPNPNPNNPLGLCPSSPSISALTVQSSAAVAVAAASDANLRDSASVSKP